MPNYPWLATNDMDLSSLSRKLQVLASFPMNTPYSDSEIRGAVDIAKAQAKKIAAELRQDAHFKDMKDLENKEMLAIIAYLQRLGTDLGKSEKAEAAK